MREPDSYRGLSGEEARQKCHLGTGRGTCRFLGAGQHGFQCLWLVSAFRAELDQRARTGQMQAIGEACEDPWDNHSETKLPEGVSP